jgi:hypothetical protein
VSPPADHSTTEFGQGQGERGLSGAVQWRSRSHARTRRDTACARQACAQLCRLRPMRLRKVVTLPRAEVVPVSRPRLS